MTAPRATNPVFVLDLFEHFNEWLFVAIVKMDWSLDKFLTETLAHFEFEVFEFLRGVVFHKFVTAYTYMRIGEMSIYIPLGLGLFFKAAFTSPSISSRSWVISSGRM